MKTLYLFFILTAFTGISANLYSQVKKDTTVSKSIFIDAKGGIHNHAGTRLGYIDKDNIVRNNKGQKLYFIDKNGNVIDAKGKNLGRAKKNGNYYNAKGENVIMVKDKNATMCEIVDPKGHKLGTVHKNYKLHACAAHCFFKSQAKPK